MEDEKKIKYWVNLSEYDLETARAMLKTKRFLYVGFMCHQSIEKIFKGYYFYVLKKTPPYTHNLSVLAEESLLYQALSDGQKDFIDLLSPLNINARYPAFKENLFKELDEVKCVDILNKTEELHKWIKIKLLK